MDEVYDIAEASKAQIEYCQAKNVPYLAPKSGICYDCFENIYRPRYGKKTGGISVKEAGSRMITGCPHCNKSFCD